MYLTSTGVGGHIIFPFYFFTLTRIFHNIQCVQTYLLIVRPSKKKTDFLILFLHLVPFVSNN